MKTMNVDYGRRIWMQRIVKLLVVLTALPASVFAQRDLKRIPDSDPLLQLAELDVAPEFEINLYAADPRIAKPIQMNFDPSGRLWVASSEVYPQIEPGQQADDKILVIEDQDRDGVADTTTVFARGLLIPTGVAPGDGGAYVANSTELLHLEDTNGDGVADTERVMLSGFGTEDTHHILHTLRWGPEGLLYMNQSIYIHSHIETPYGVRRMNGGGVWHFRPETMQLEPYTYGLVNPWGHAFDEFGQSFQTDGAGGEGINYVFPDFVGRTSPGAKRIMSGLNPGKPKLCGLEIIGGSHIPEDWRGNLIANDFRAHRVCRYKLTDDGAGYVSRELEELVKTRHQAFRPIDVKLGPDGAIYIADWYNPIIQHGEVDFRDPRRDHTHGRIWRIVAKDRPLLPYKDLRATDTEELLQLLRSEEPYWRDQAKRVLKERGAAEVMPHMRLLRSEFSGRSKLEVLWVYQALDVVNEELLNELLADTDPRIRAGATRVLYHWQDRVAGKIELLARLAVDQHPRVRMEAAHALRRCDEPEAALIALRGIDQPTDRFLEYALQQTADLTQQNWLPVLKEDQPKIRRDPAAMLFALQAADTAEAVPLLIKALPSWEHDPLAVAEVMKMVAARGTAEEMAHVFRRAIDANTKAPVRRVLLDALASASKRRKLKPRADLGAILPIMESSTDHVRAVAAELAGLWELPEAKDRLIKLAQNQQVNSLVREAAVRGLAAMSDIASLQSLNDPEVDPSFRVACVAGVAAIDISSAAAAAIELLPQLEESHDPARLIRAFLNQDGGDVALTNAFNAGTRISPDVAKLCVRVARSSGRDVERLVQKLQDAGGLAGDSKLPSADEQAQLLADALADGDPTRGEAIYRRPALNCQKCHAIGGAGGRVGPDLASIGASAPPDYILQSLLDPDAKIKENYHSQVVATDDGQVLTGVLLRQTKDSLILRDAEDEEISIPLESIEERRDGGSLMPAGLLNELTRQEMLDLVRFLTELGKVGRFALPSEPLVRTWETLSADVNRDLLKQASESEIAVDQQFVWQPVYATVSGAVLQQELPRHRPSNATQDVTYLRFRIDMPTAGKRTLKLSRGKGSGVRVYVDGHRVDTKWAIVLELEAGTHSVMLSIDYAPERIPIGVLLE